MAKEKEEDIKKINELNVNGRKYVIYELIKNKKYYQNGCYAVMFDDNGEHGLYVTYNDLTQDKIEQAFRDLGYIEPDEKTIFVFGSNPEGRHGAGSAKIALNKFGFEIPHNDKRVSET